MSKKAKICLILLAFHLGVTSGIGLCGPGEVNEEIIADLSVEPEILMFTPKVAASAFELRVTGPNGFLFNSVFGPNEVPYFDSFDENWTPRPEGAYVYELRATPLSSSEEKGILDQISQDPNRDLVSGTLKTQGLLPQELPVQSGAFLISNGGIMKGGLKEPVSAKKGDTSANKDQVIPDDLIVQSSICTGFDCVNNESFGADTIRLKENNLRIHFDDTSSTGSFPSNDWRIVANDQANGGSSYLGFEDSTAGRFPFRIQAGAPAGSLAVNNSGNVGLGTFTPVLDMHIVNGNTPAIRLEQNGTSGFSPQTWDVAGNEANFFVRDITNGSRLPFKIIPGAPSNSFVISSIGRIGIGTLSPQGKLHVATDSPGPGLFVSDVGNVGIGTSAPQKVLHVVANTNGNHNLLVENQGTGTSAMWLKGNAGAASFTVGSAGTSFLVFDVNAQLARMTVTSAGNVGIGTTNPSTKLDVAGTATVDFLNIDNGMDLSEKFHVRNPHGETVEPGMVLSIDPSNPGELLVSSSAHDRTVAGIVSGAGGINTGMLMGQAGSPVDGKVPVALTGRVYCLADATFGPIQPGDLLTTSETPGHAMKVTDHDSALGAIIGKAMTDLEGGQGLVLVLVNLQ